MNPRRVHELMLHHFPPINYVDHDWVVAVDTNGVRMFVIEALINKFIEGDELIIEVHRKQGDCLKRAEALRYISENGTSGLKLSDRTFSGYVVIASNGVATGWKNISIESSANAQSHESVSR